MQGSSWLEVAPEVFVRAYDHLDLNICVIRGDDDLLVVDSRSSPVEAAELEADLQLFRPARVRMLVNTHAHFDHTFGNQRFGAGSALDVPIYGHRLLPAHLDSYERPRLAAWLVDPAGEPDHDWRDLRITGPTHLVAADQTLIVGSRAVELHPLGPGHTDTDLVLHIPDARTWIVGDVVEASGPPMYGSGCFPLDLPAQLARVLDKIDPTEVVVPGHGPIVDRAFVVAQQADVERLAQQIRAVWSRGDTVDQALADQEPWPFPVEALRLAVERGYLALDAAADIRD